jgi:hypothetical protein
MALIFRVLKEVGYISEPGWKEAEEIIVGEGRPRVLIKAVKIVKDY